nr:D-3-phosphoglycerate dehydrogenase 3, chloroplastic-like [Arachis hypogaea]
MATAHSQTLRISSLSSSSSLSLSSAFSISFRSSRRAARPLVVFVFASLDAKPTILIAEKLGEAGLKLLKEFANVDCSYNLSPEELCTKISLCDALIIRSGTKVTREVFQSSASRLKVVERAGIGIDNVDLDAVTEHGCLVVNAPPPTLSPPLSTGSRFSQPWLGTLLRLTRLPKLGKKLFEDSPSLFKDPKPSQHFSEIPLTASIVAANPNHSPLSATSSFSPLVTPALNT